MQRFLPTKRTRVTTAAEDVAKALKAWGIRRAFALCADQTNTLLGALSVEGIAVVGTRQESAALHMADGWARPSDGRRESSPRALSKWTPTCAFHRIR